MCVVVLQTCAMTRWSCPSSRCCGARLAATLHAMTPCCTQHSLRPAVDERHSLFGLNGALDELRRGDRARAARAACVTLTFFFPVAWLSRVYIARERARRNEEEEVPPFPRARMQPVCVHGPAGGLLTRREQKTKTETKRLWMGQGVAGRGRAGLSLAASCSRGSASSELYFLSPGMGIVLLPSRPAAHRPSARGETDNPFYYVRPIRAYTVKGKANLETRLAKRAHTFTLGVCVRNRAGAAGGVRTRESHLGTREICMQKKWLSIQRVSGQEINVSSMCEQSSHHCPGKYVVPWTATLLGRLPQTSVFFLFPPVCRSKSEKLAWLDNEAGRIVSRLSSHYAFHDPGLFFCCCFRATEVAGLGFADVLRSLAALPARHGAPLVITTQDVYGLPENCSPRANTKSP